MIAELVGAEEILRRLRMTQRLSSTEFKSWSATRAIFGTGVMSGCLRSTAGCAK
jgi:hypothetical protein